MPSMSDFRASSSRMVDKAKSAVGMEIESKPSEDSDFAEDISEFCPKLSFQQRVIGFFSCFALGYLITFCSFKFFVKLIEGNPVPFVLVYTLGNILALLSSMFLCGPKRQVKNMFDEKRKLTATIYLSCLASSVVLCFIPFGNLSTIKLFLLILLLLAQFCASLWYTLSYIPFGRRTASKFLKGLVGDGEGAANGNDSLVS